MALELSSLLVKPFECAELFRAPQFCFLDRRFQYLNGLVVHGERHRKRMPVLAAMGKREPRWVGEAVRGSVYDFGDHRQRTHGPCSDAGN